MQHRTSAQGCSRTRNFGKMVFQHLLDIFFLSRRTRHISEPSDRVFVQPSLFSSHSSRYPRIIQDRRTERCCDIVFKFADIEFQDQLLNLFLSGNALLYVVAEAFLSNIGNFNDAVQEFVIPKTIGLRITCLMFVFSRRVLTRSTL